MVAHPDTDKDLAPSLFVKAINDTLGPEGYVPSSPAVYTKSEAPKTRLSLESRSVLAMMARKEPEKIMAKMRVQRALKHRIPPAVSVV